MVNLTKLWGAIKPVLTALTDLLMIGRGKGWWSRGHGPSTGPSGQPHQPGPPLGRQ